MTTGGIELATGVRLLAGHQHVVVAGQAVTADVLAGGRCGPASFAREFTPFGAIRVDPRPSAKAGARSCPAKSATPPRTARPRPGHPVARPPAARNVRARPAPAGNEPRTRPSCARTRESRSAPGARPRDA
ncbi:hypothetical protein EAO69_38435 [Streptomyces sp. me109]|nr:hypothetical protein EAO69_38435 [Streptomyces sp. me109]